MTQKKRTPAVGSAHTRQIPTAIRVADPVTPADHIVLGIRKLIAASIFFNAQNAEKIGLGLTDMQMIHMLQLYGPSTPGRLGEWTGLSSGGVTVALDRLEKAGFLRRAPNPKDRRSHLITLNSGRMAELTRMYEGVERETRRRIDQLSTTEQEAIVRFFDALAAPIGGSTSEQT